MFPGRGGACCSVSSVASSPVDAFELWDPAKLGALAARTAVALESGQISGKEGHRRGAAAGGDRSGGDGSPAPIRGAATGVGGAQVEHGRARRLKRVAEGCVRSGQRVGVAIPPELPAFRGWALILFVAVGGDLAGASRLRRRNPPGCSACRSGRGTAVVLARVVRLAFVPDVSAGAHEGAVEQHDGATLPGDLLQGAVQVRRAGRQQLDDFQQPPRQVASSTRREWSASRSFDCGRRLCRQG